MNFFFAMYDAGIMRLDYMRLWRVSLKLATECQPTPGQRRNQVRDTGFRRMIRVNGYFLVAFLGLIPPCCGPLRAQRNTATPLEIPRFYTDVLPVVQEHCQVCHRSGGI